MFYAIGLNEWNGIDVVLLYHEQELKELEHRYKWLTSKKFDFKVEAEAFIKEQALREDLPLGVMYALKRHRGFPFRDNTEYCLD